MSRTKPILAAALLAFLASGARAAEKHDPAAKGGCEHCDKEKAAAAQKAPPSGAVDAKVVVVDKQLQDQDGAKVRFGKDVVGGGVVVVDFVFTNCTTICPVLSAKFTRIQSLLGDRVEKGVKLVSMSLDPVRDTPDRLKAYGAKYHAGKAWSFLTGPKQDVDDVLKGLGAYVPNFYDHPPMVLVGDGKSGRWVRINGFPDPQRILSVVDEMLASRKPTTARADRP